MQKPAINFDVAHYKQIMDQAPTKENGWELDYEGVARKDAPGKHN